MIRSASTRIRILALLFFSGAGLVALPAPDGLPALRPAAQPTLLFIQAPSGSGGDVYAYNRLQALGFATTYGFSDTVQTADANGKDIVVISSSALRSGVNTKFKASAVPVLTWNSGLMSDMGMVAGTSGTDYGTTSAQNALAILNAADPLAAGQTGTVAVTTQNDTFSWGLPNGNALKIASITGNSTRCTEFAYEAGAVMPGATAPARRLGFFMTNQTMLYLNPAGTALFDQAVRWTALKPPTGLAAIPGDTRVQIRWTTTPTATSYRVKRSTTAGGPYTTVASSVNGASFIDSSLTNGTKYYYVVSGLNSSCESKNSSELSVTPNPGLTAPANFSGTAVSKSSIKWTWTDTLDEDYYTVHDAAHTQLVASGPDSPFFTETGLAENTSYSRHVHSVNDNGTGPASTSASRATLVHDPLAADFYLKVISATQIDVVVTPPANSALGSTGVQIERSTDGTTWAVIKPFSSVYGTSDTGLQSTRTYAYRITFRNQEGAASAVSQTRATQPQSAVPLGNPGLYGTSTNPTQILWTWNDVTGESNYVLHDDAHVVKATIPSDVLGYTETGLAENTAYSRHLHAVNGIGEGPPSGSLSVRTPIHDPLAADFTLALQTGNQVLVTVTPPANPSTASTRVVIQRSLDQFTWTNVNTAQGQYSVTDTGLVGGQTYVYQIQYYNAESRPTGWSPTKTVTTSPAPPPAPTGLSGAAQSTSSIQWVWQDVPGETGFVLHDDAHAVKGTIGSGLTSFLETGIPENSLASRHVHATNASGQSPATPTLARWTQVHTPTAADFTLTAAPTGTSVTVTITPPPNGTTASSAVTVSRTSDGVNWATLQYAGQTYTLNDTGLVGGTTYTYKIQFYNGDRSYASPYSPPQNVTTPLVAPVTPGGFTGTVQSPTSILWSWADVANESGFKLVDPTAGNAVKATIGPSILSTLETGLPENSSVSRALQATNASGASPNTGTVALITRVHNPTTADFSLSVVSGTQINVAVTPLPNGTVGYTGVQIERSSDRLNWSVVKGMSSAYTFSDTGLIGSTTYYYRIWFRNQNASYNSPYSPIVSATTPAAPAPTPAGFSGTVKSTTSIQWAWNDVDGATGFQVLDNANGNAVKGTTGAGVLNFLESGLTENTSYSRTLIATNATGNSPPTGALVRVTRVHDPSATDLSLTVVSGTQITVSVTPPPNGTTGYTGVQIDRSTDQLSWATVKGMSNAYTFNDVNLLGGTKYYYRCWTRNSDASYNSGYSPTVSATTSPAVPPAPALSGTVLGLTSIQWSWSLIANATSYLVQDASHTTIATLPSATLSWTETGLSENTAYTRYVVAVNGAGNGPSSAALTRTTMIHNPPAADFSLSGVTATQINVTVVPPANSTVGYTGVQIERSTDQVNWTVVKGMNNTYTFNDTGLIGGIPYYYRIWIRNGDASYNSAYSPVQTATTLAGPPGTPNFNVSTVTTNSIVWYWSGVPAETNYVLHDASHALIATIAPNLTSYQETGLSENAAYTRHVHAVNASGQGPASGSITRSTLVHNPTSSDVTFTVVSGTQINVAVSPPPNSTATYTGVQIDRSIDQLNWATVKGMSSVYTLNDTGLTGNTTYSYRIVYRNTDGTWTSYTPPLTSTTTPAAPPAPTLSASPLTTTSIVWSWTNVQGVTRYELRDSSNTVIGTTIPGQLNFTETGLSENTAYTRSVFAINAAGTSPASTAVTRYTRIHDPTTGVQPNDLFASVNASTGVYTVTVVPPPNAMAGQTGVQIEANTGSGWQVVKPLNNTYTYTGATGGNLWRCWFRNGDGTYNSVTSHRYNINPTVISNGSTTPTNPPPTTVGGSSDSPTSIVWTWSDTDISDLGFILLVEGTTGSSNNLFYRQTGIAENTQHSFAVASANIGTCPYGPTITRFTRVHDPGVGDFALTASANQVAVTVTPPPNGTTGYTGCYIERSTDLVNWNYVSYWSPTYSITNTGLVGGKTYYYRIAFRNQDASYYSGISPWKGITVPASAPPTAPSLAGTVIDKNTIQWTWNLVPGATSYVLQDAANAGISPVLGSGIMSWLETGLGENTTVNRHLVPSNATGAGPSSNALSRTTFVHNPAPADMSLALVAGQQINVTVTPPPNGTSVYTGVQIERSLDQLNWLTVKGMSNVYTYSDPNLVGNTTYYYRIWFRNQDASYSTNYSVVQSLTTGAAVPATPSSFTGTAQSPTSISWSWPGVLGATGYVVHDDAHTVKGTVGAGITYFLETGLPENTVASRHVHATNATGAGAASVTYAPATRVHDPGTSDFTLTVVSGSQITIAVTPPPNPTTLYTGVQIQRSIDRINWTTIQYMSPTYTANDINLIEGTTYHYMILFRNSDARYNSAWSPVKSVTTTTTATLAPASFSGSFQSPTSILWTWAGVLGSTGYQLQDGTGATKATIGNGITSYLETGLPENTAVSRKVVATNASGASPASTTVTLTSRIHDPAPGDISVTTVSGSQLNIVVTPPPNPAVGYTGVQIDRSTDRRTWVNVKGLNNVYTLNDTGLVGGTTYYYRIYYRNSDASYSTPWSPNVSGTTQAGPPAAPNPFNGIVQSSSSVYWSWNDVPAETGFVLHDDAHVLKGTIGAGVLSFLETGLPENTLVSRHVHATNASGAGPASATVAWWTQVHTPTTADLTLTAASGSQVNVSVVQPPNATTGSTQSQIQRSADSINWATIKYPSNVYTVTDTGLIGGRTYYYRVQYLNGDARFWTPWSPPKAVTTPATVPPPTTSFTGVAMTPSSILWSWSDVPAETGWVLHDDAHAVIATLGSGITTLLETGLGENARVSRHVHATNSLGSGAAGPTYARYTLAHTPVAANLTVSALSSTQVSVTITSIPIVPAGSSGVAIQHSSDGVNWSYASSFSPIFAYTDSALVPNITYWYKFLYQNGDGIQTPWSPPRSVHTPAGPPATPSSFYGAPSTFPVFSISWGWYPVPGATSYKLYDTQDQLIATLSGTTTSFLETGILDNAVYSRYLVAINASGTSAPTAASKVTMPIHTPTSGEFSVLAKSGEQVLVVATPPNNPTSGSTGMLLYRSTDGANFSYVNGVGGWYSLTDNVSPKTTYWYKIAFSSINGSIGGQSPAWKITTPIGTPKNFTGVAQSTTSVLWSWSAITGATAFSLTDAGGVVKGTPAGTATTFIETGIGENTVALRSLTASDSAGPGASSTAAMCTLIHDALATDFTLSSPSATQITVTVVPPPNPTSGSTGVEIQRLVGTTWTTVQAFSTAYTFVDTGLTASTPYSYRVRYRNNYNTTAAYSPSKSATTQPPAPLAPTGLTVTGSTTTSLSWSWTAAATAATYELRDSTQVVKATVTDPTVTVTESGLTENLQVTRHVNAINSGGASPDSSSVTKRTQVHQAGPADLFLAVTSGTQINVSVTPPPNSTSGSTGVQIQRSPDNATWTTIKAYSNVYTYSDTALTANTTYWYRIQFRNGDGTANAAASTSVSVKTATLGAPAGLAGVALSSSSIKWTWTNTVGNTGYQLQDSANAVKASPAANATTVTETGLSQNTSYTRHLVAMDGLGAGTASANVSAYSGVHDPTLSDFNTLGGTTNQVDITIVPPPNSTAGSTGCQLQRSTDGTTWTTIKPFSNVYAFSDTGLTTGTKYWYRIQFRNANGVATAFSPSKTEVSVPTPVVTTTTHKVRNKTPTIQGTVGSGATTVTVTVGSTSYAATLSGTTWSLTTPTLAEGVYTVSAQAAVSGFLSSVSNTITLTIDVTPPAPPTNIRTKAYNNTIDVEWDASTAADVVGYLVYRKVGATGTWTLLTGSGVVLGTKYRDSGLTNGTTYFYHVTTVDNAQPN